MGSSCLFASPNIAASGYAKQLFKQISGRKSCSIPFTDLSGSTFEPQFFGTPHMIHSLAILSTALLFGGMTLYSFGFAAFLFSALPAVTAGKALRQAFPWFYGFVIATAGLGALFWWPENMVSAGTMVAIALTTVLLRQLLMPAINAATDTRQRRRFKWLHGLSVVVTLGHIAATGWLLATVS